MQQSDSFRQKVVICRTGLFADGKRTAVGQPSLMKSLQMKSSQMGAEEE